MLNGLPCTATKTDCSTWNYKYWVNGALAESGSYSTQYIGKQCFAYAEYIECKLYGSCWRLYQDKDHPDGEKFDRINGYGSYTNIDSNWTGAKLDADQWKTYVTETLSAYHVNTLHIRTGASGEGKHSMTVVEANASSITIIDANYDEKCGIRWKKYSWSTFASVFPYLLYLEVYNGYKDTEAVTSLSLSQTTASIAAGATVTLTAKVDPSTAAVTWSSSDTSVATVANGLVTGVAAGTATITASAGTKTASC